MAYVKEYWTDRDKRAEKAKEHTEKMEREYGDLIQASIWDTIDYSPYFVCYKEFEDVNTEIIVEDIDSVSAIFKYRKETENGRLAVLNFSSYKNPGGMFLNGSKAQEECLCHESFLYNVLANVAGFYEWNNLHKNKALYRNRALYSPNIMFVRENKKMKL